jgi:uncharacterized protein
MAHDQSRHPHGLDSPPACAAIGLICKTPAAGAVKTRLCPPLAGEQAAMVAAAMLADTAANAAATGHDLWCVYAGDPDGLPALLPGGARLLAQRGDNLARRLAAAQTDLHGRGYERVLLLGGDCPTVEPAYLAEAVAALRDHDVVLGPAVDGGYTLIGTRRAEPALFDVEMSTPHVLSETLSRAAAVGLRAWSLAPRRDLDTADDIAAALAEGQLDAAPRTAALVGALWHCLQTGLVP